MSNTTSNTVANQALQLVGDNMPEVTGEWPTFDDSTAGNALNRLYGPCVETVSRQFSWDFARKTIDLVPSGNTAPFPWTFEYLYPTSGIQVWQLMPATADIPDLNNPLPTNWSVANAVVGSVQQRVIQTDIPNAQAVYNNNPNENTWDSGFREAVVRLLSSELAIAIAGKPETSMLNLQTAGTFTDIAKGRDS